MEQIVKQGLLYDFYGELLTDYQKAVYEDLVYNNLSISEIASDNGISRQAASDLIKRIDKKLNTYEDKLKLVEKFLHIKKSVLSMDKLTDEEKDLILKEL